MSAEEELLELYESQKPLEGRFKDGCVTLINNAGVYVPAETIDLIADLVVERLKKDLLSQKEVK